MRRGFVGGIASALIFSSCSPPDPEGFSPPSGFDNATVDYDAPQFPIATPIEVPLFSIPEFGAANEPGVVELSFPEWKGDHPLVFVGEIRHPNPAVQASFVRGRCYVANGSSGSERRRVESFDGVAEGMDGVLVYRVEGRAPKDPGQYQVELELWHPITDPDLESYPLDDRMTTTTFAAGWLSVTE
jgi:hypothetical protein